MAYKRDLSKPLAPTFGDDPKKKKAPADTTSWKNSALPKLSNQGIENKIRQLEKMSSANRDDNSFVSKVPVIDTKIGILYREAAKRGAPVSKPKK